MMVSSKDFILDGVRPNEVASLTALAAGRPVEGSRAMAPLQAKGWVELVGGVPLITLTGRTLLDRALKRIPLSGA